MAFATVAGMPAAVTLPASLPAAFLLSDFSAVLSAVLDECWRAWRRPCRELCRADLSVVALSDFAADESVPAACAGNGAVRPTRSPVSPVATIKAKRPLALIFILMISPFRPSQTRNETPVRVHTGAKKGNLRASGGESWAISSQSVVDGSSPDACRTDRCYEPWRLETRRSDSLWLMLGAVLPEDGYHEFVMSWLAA
ncbi:hypothetical protein [Bradyrhizobium acaciae]|uniref:hypothetical protein n=1 Tax=Bradyrhizobium acaciae TaxID=2683706 RepID=UPI001E5BDE40|nr:hypothetical protein [Bradyrhizobium acaciae]